LNIYVGNLPRSTNEEEVRKLFTEVGEVAEINLITDRYTGELRGFGFITMPNAEEAKKAIETVNGKELGGRALVVNEAKPKTDRPRGGGGGGGGFNRGGGQRGGGDSRKRW